MGDFVIEYVGMLVRWLHLVAGIAWIGTSFYFVWLDNHLEPTTPAIPGVAGEVWSVHGGGIYNKRKYAVAPSEAPRRLHWFKWEAYWTWISGFTLLALVYFSRPREFLISPERPGLASGWAIALSIALLAAAWLVYDALCRSPLVRSGWALVGAALVVVPLAHWGIAQVFSGRGAFIQVGAMLGTIMVANVLMVIIPGQRRVVAAMLAGREPDPRDGARGKERSLHNNYITLPVLLIMLSNHYPVLTNDAWAPLLLAGFVAVGMATRHFVNLRHRGVIRPAYLVAAAAILVAIGAYLAPDDRPRASGAPAATFAQVQPVIVGRCSACHSLAPTWPGYTSAPAGVALDAPAKIVAQARRIYEQAVLTKVMPLGNVTKITDAERDTIARWYRGGAPGP